MTNQKKYPIFSIIMGCLFFLAFVFTVFIFWQQAKKSTEKVIAEDVARLARIFKTIDATCGILNFEHEKNYIDFLNVKSFAGSEVGAMNLINASAWQGPYLEDNPTVQEKYYQIINTKKGHFIVPGDGVVLSNGAVVGKDIIFDAESDIPAMLLDASTLGFSKKPLAAMISITGNHPFAAARNYSASIAVEALKD